LKKLSATALPRHTCRSGGASHILEEIEESAILQVTKPKAEQVNGSRASSTPIEGDTVPQV
jgi:hypothetical protein